MRIRLGTGSGKRHVLEKSAVQVYAPGCARPACLVYRIDRRGADKAAGGRVVGDADGGERSCVARIRCGLTSGLGDAQFSRTLGTLADTTWLRWRRASCRRLAIAAHHFFSAIGCVENGLLPLCLVYRMLRLRQAIAQILIIWFAVAGLSRAPRLVTVTDASCSMVLLGYSVVLGAIDNLLGLQAVSYVLCAAYGLCANLRNQQPFLPSRRNPWPIDSPILPSSRTQDDEKMVDIPRVPISRSDPCSLQLLDPPSDRRLPDANPFRFYLRSNW